MAVHSLDCCLPETEGDARPWQYTVWTAVWLRLRMMLGHVSTQSGLLSAWDWGWCSAMSVHSLDCCLPETEGDARPWQDTVWTAVCLRLRVMLGHGSNFIIFYSALQKVESPPGCTPDLSQIYSETPTNITFHHGPITWNLWVLGAFFPEPVKSVNCNELCMRENLPNPWDSPVVAVLVAPNPDRFNPGLTLAVEVAPSPKLKPVVNRLEPRFMVCCTVTFYQIVKQINPSKESYFLNIAWSFSSC